MDKELFADLLESVKQAKAIREGRMEAAHTTKWNAVGQKWESTPDRRCPICNKPLWRLTKREEGYPLEVCNNEECERFFAIDWKNSPRRLE